MLRTWLQEVKSPLQNSCFEIQGPSSDHCKQLCQITVNIYITIHSWIASAQVSIIQTLKSCLCWTRVSPCGGFTLFDVQTVFSHLELSLTTSRIIIKFWLWLFVHRNWSAVILAPVTVSACPRLIVSFQIGENLPFHGPVAQNWRLSQYFWKKIWFQDSFWSRLLTAIRPKK